MSSYIYGLGNFMITLFTILVSEVYQKLAHLSAIDKTQITQR